MDSASGVRAHPAAYWPGVTASGHPLNRMSGGGWRMPIVLPDRLKRYAQDADQ